MNILMIEDEEEAAKRLKRLIKKIRPQVFIHGPIESVEGAVNWFESNPTPNLILLDIHLSDGLSFEIFEAIATNAPVIFTTAYDQYALRAFKLNSIDYLLKPIEEEGLLAAFEKYEAHHLKSPEQHMGQGWHQTLAADYKEKYKKRFVTRIGDRIVAIETSDVMYAFSENKATYLLTPGGKKHLIDFSLEQLEAMLDPKQFFRLNRKYIARYDAINEILAYSNSRLKVTLKHCTDPDIVLSRDRTRMFKEWLDA